VLFDFSLLILYTIINNYTIRILKGPQLLLFIVKHSPKIILFLAVTAVVAGVLMQEPSKVFDQAIRVCLSCIGIG